MMKNSVLVCLLIFICIPLVVRSQVGINTDVPNSRAVLDLQSPTNDQGLLVPRLSRLQRTAQAFTSRLTEAENGLLIFDTDDNGFYYWKHPSWEAVGDDGGGTVWRSGEVVPSNSLGENGDFYLDVVDGNIYQKSNGVYALTSNIRGPQGPEGPQGIQGEIGPQGEKGDTGAMGLQGPQGEVGPMGPQGIQGEVGPMGQQGPQGEKGDTGEMGPQGPQGEIGPMGPQGIQGEVGPMGPSGPQGIQGEVGPQGPQGEMGPQGEIGPQGPQGEVGPAGPQGIQGEIGPMGLQGPQGDPGTPVAFRAVTVNSNYTAQEADDVIIVAGNITVTLPSAGSVPGKVYHIRHNFGLLGLLGTATIRAPAGNSIVDGSAGQTFTIGLLNPTAISLIAVDVDKWYVISKF